MKQWKEPSTERFLKGLFLCLSILLLVAAVLCPDRQNMLSGLYNIISKPAKIPTNYFSPGYGGLAGSLLNMGLVCLICTGLCFLPGTKLNGTTVLAVLLTVGFGTWGLNVLNIWFGFFGVAIYCITARRSLGSQLNAMLFTTGLAPLYSDLLLCYPSAESIGFHWQGILLAIGIGIIVGFLLPVTLERSFVIHHGYDLFNAAMPLGLIAFLLRGFLYTVLGVARGTSDVGVLIGEEIGLHFTSATLANAVYLCFFGLCIVAALLMGCRWRHYRVLLDDTGYRSDFLSKYGIAPSLMNLGVYGLFILLYFNLVAAISGSLVFNGVTFGCIFCMVCTCCAGATPKNVWPIMVGYLLMSMLSRLLVPANEFLHTLDSQAILVGLCFSAGLAPISGRYGWCFGMAASMLHFCLVTSVPLLHGGFCLYNGGFTAALTCMLLVPFLKHYFHTKERTADRAKEDVAV